MSSTIASGDAPGTSAGPASVPTRALVIIPAFNEEASLPAVLRDLHADRPDLDVLVVSDGSTDATADVARTGGAVVIELAFNLGIGGALRTGFRYAARHAYRAAVQFDADGQHDPSAVEVLLAGVRAGADLVIGSRFLDGGAPTYTVGRVRRLAMRVLERCVRLAAGRRFSDTSSGFRGFSAPMLAYFAEHYPVEYMDSVEALVIAYNAGFDVREVTADMRGRTGGAPSTRGWKLAYYYVRLLVVLLTSYTRRGSRRDAQVRVREAAELGVQRDRAASGTRP